MLPTTRPLVDVTDRLRTAAARIMQIDDTTLGEGADYQVRFRGRLLIDSRQAYTQAAESFRELGYTPLFRKEGDTHVVLRAQLASRVTERLDSYREMLAASRNPWTTRLDDARTAAIRRQWRDDGGFLVSHGWSSDPWGFTALPLNLASARVARAAIAVERYRLAHNGQLPETLDQTVPAFLPVVPTDPYSGRSIRFVRIDGGYKVDIKFTLTAPGCPVAGEMPGWVENAVGAVEGVEGI